MASLKAETYNRMWTHRCVLEFGPCSYKTLLTTLFYPTAIIRTENLLLLVCAENNNL